MLEDDLMEENQSLKRVIDSLERQLMRLQKELNDSVPWQYYNSVTGEMEQEIDRLREENQRLREAKENPCAEAVGKSTEHPPSSTTGRSVEPS